MQFFSPGERVLEIGGGSGFQASLLAAHGCDVTSIDVDTRPDPRAQRYGRQYYPVSTYDAAHLPFANASFDVVFSSHALYHAQPIELMLAEIRRVLRLHGAAVLVLPSSSWRFYTSLAHYPNLIWKLVAKLSRAKAQQVVAADAAAIKPQRPRLWNILVSKPISPASGIVAEWLLFRRSQWCSALFAAGFEVEILRSGPLFYTGQLFAPELPFTVRAALGRLLGTGSFICVARHVK